MPDDKTDYRATLNLPDTPFPTRTDLPKREPKWVEQWEGEGLYKRLRDALGRGDMESTAVLLGRPYSISGHVVHGRKLGRELGFPTLNLRFSHWKSAASGIFVVQVHGLSDEPVPGVANLGIRPSLDPDDANGGRVLLETHCLEWPQRLGLKGGYGKIIQVDLLHKLHDELKYDSLDALRAGIARDGDEARAWFAATRRQTTRDRI